VEEWNTCFLQFDHIIDKHNLEKIKTIGDAYMCAGGIPVKNTTNPIDVVKAGLEIKQFMDELKNQKEARGEGYWEIRIGIHTGPVIAGVVGKNKFAYDIWGDAVNTASRMESSGIPGKVNISGATYELVKDHFRCNYRGKIPAKNKGEIDMYIAESVLEPVPANKMILV
jgi:class 3 adenylate cyclase